jgi:hypothetical protein
MKKIFENICFYLIIISFLNYTGCYSSKVVGKENFFSEISTEPINDLTIVTNDDNKFVMDDVTYQVIDDTLYLEGINRTNDSVYGQLIDKKIALDDIQYVEIEELNSSKTTGCIIGLTGLVVLFIGLIAAASSQPKSCKGPPSNLADWD